MPAKKGHPALDRLLRLTQTYRAHQETYRLLKQHHACLCQIAHLLTPPEQGHGEEAAWEAQWQVWGFVQDVACHAPAFGQHLATWVKNLGHHLFACFLTPQLPCTNNDLERFFRHAKGAYRRMTGRRNWNDYLLRLGRYTVFHEEQEATMQVLDRFRHVPYGGFRAERTAWRASLEPVRQRFRFRRQPKRYLQALEAAWSSP